MKKLLAVILAAGLCICSCTACGSSNKDESSLTQDEERTLLAKNNKAASQIYSAINFRIASLYAEGKGIPAAGTYSFKVSKDVMDYSFVPQQNAGTQILTMTTDETNTFLSYTAANYQNYVPISANNDDYPIVDDGYTVIVIDDTNNIGDVYFSDSEKGEYTGSYPIAPVSAPSYSIESCPMR